MMTSVDVIIPCYRYGHFLKTCVDSVLDQAGVDVRVLILDDASPDNTATIASDLAHSDHRVSVIHHAINRGHIPTFNEGLDWASSKYLLLLSADDYLLPGALARATAVMELFPDVGFTFGNALMLTDDGQFGSNNAFAAHDGAQLGDAIEGLDFIRYCGARNPVATPTAVVRTALQKLAGGYRPELTHAGDLEMWFRLAAFGRVGFVDTPQAVYRVHQNNMSHHYLASMLADIEQRRRAFELFFEHAELPAAEAGDLQARLFGALAADAIGWASISFNEGRIDTSRELSAMAREFYPPVVRTAPWLKLAIKRGLGLRAWLALEATWQALSRSRAGRSA